MFGGAIGTSKGPDEGMSMSASANSCRRNHHSVGLPQLRKRRGGAAYSSIRVLYMGEWRIKGEVEVASDKVHRTPSNFER